MYHSVRKIDIKNLSLTFTELQLMKSPVLRTSVRLLAIVGATALVCTGASCQKVEEEPTVEDAAEAASDVLEDAADAVVDAVDDVQDAAEDGASDLQNLIKETSEDALEAGKEMEDILNQAIQEQGSVAPIPATSEGE